MPASPLDGIMLEAAGLVTEAVRRGKLPRFLTVRWSAGPKKGTREVLNAWSSRGVRALRRSLMAEAGGRVEAVPLSSEDHTVYPLHALFQAELICRDRAADYNGVATVGFPDRDPLILIEFGGPEFGLPLLEVIQVAQQALTVTVEHMAFLLLATQSWSPTPLVIWRVSDEDAADVMLHPGELWRVKANSDAVGAITAGQ